MIFAQKQAIENCANHGKCTTSRRNISYEVCDDLLASITGTCKIQTFDKAIEYISEHQLVLVVEVDVNVRYLNVLNCGEGLVGDLGVGAVIK